MNYASFYGGPQGASFVITQNFATVADMQSAFSKGTSIANIGEYVLIDTKNKNNPDNGKIYRRGQDNTPIYIGQIVGPSGDAPALALENYSTTEADTEGKTEEEKAIEHYMTGEVSVDNNSLVPGKDGEEFNDSIKWIGYTIKKEDNSESVVHLGIKIPYLTIETKSKSVKPYNENGEYIDKVAAIRDDDQTHPFYHRILFNIPKGIKGDTFKNLEIVTINENNYNDFGAEITEIDKGKQFLFYTYYNYDDKEDGNPQKICLGEYKTIKSVNLDENNGAFIIKYTNNEIAHIAITYPKSLTFDSGEIEGEGSQKLKVTYSTGEEKDISPPINYIMETQVTDSNHLLFLHSDPKKREELKNPLITWRGRNDWQDLGSIKDDDGILIGLVLEANNEHYTTIESTIVELNQNYPKGFANGKVIVVTNQQVSAEGSSTKYQNSNFYGFDYTYKKAENGQETQEYKGWKFLGTFSNNLVVVGAETEENQTLANNLANGGIWLVTEEIDNPKAAQSN